ncbi:uncharacterized protein LOC123381494 isoform X3 [Felis catus]|uniref:uncharacterized protein LOC123381494 isoform X3 n=1 Tax=Felis catus TaxID=9685 RepID=UPI001D19B0D0|nr:uncharacterized protein LOC123381494 isoform X3 [Felis catus]
MRSIRLPPALSPEHLVHHFFLRSRKGALLWALEKVVRKLATKGSCSPSSAETIENKTNSWEKWKSKSSDVLLLISPTPGVFFLERCFIFKVSNCYLDGGKWEGPWKQDPLGSLAEALQIRLMKDRLTREKQIPGRLTLQDISYLGHILMSSKENVTASKCYDGSPVVHCDIVPTSEMDTTAEWRGSEKQKHQQAQCRLGLTNWKIMT